MTAFPQETATPISGQPVFFAVSLPKLAILSTFTLGLYNIYWFYQNWKLEQLRSPKPFGLSPGVRAVFAPLSSYSLFKRVNVQLTGSGERPVSAGLLALAYFVLITTSRFPDPLWLVAIFSFVPLLPVQAAVNRLNQRVAPNAPLNDRYSGVNVVFIVLGALLLALILIGLFLPPEQPLGGTPAVDI